MPASEPPTYIVVMLAAFTLFWVLGAVQTVRFWRHTTTSFDYLDRQSYLRARTRCFPVAMLSGLGMIVDGWIFIIAPSGHGYGVLLVIILVLASTVFMSLVIVGPVVLFFNEPKWLVPPHLRADSGYREVRRRRSAKRATAGR
jgi:hypothetical protein